MESVMTHDCAVKRGVPRSRATYGRSGLQGRKLQEYTFAHEVKTTLEICRDLDTPRSMCVWYLLSENSPESIAQLLSLPPPIRRNGGLRRALPATVRPNEGRRVVQAIMAVSTDMFADDYLVSEMMTKNPHLNSGIDRVAVAYEAFYQAETKNLETNNRVLSWYGSNDPNLHVITTMRAIIKKILGRLSHEKILFASSKFAFGPGATSATSGADVLLSRKYAGELHFTPRLFPYRHTLLGAVWGTFPGTDCYVHDSSRTTTVPKNAKTERLIAVECHMNIFVQKGMGALIRRQLKRFGVDLDTQAWNQFLASMAGDWHLSTLDLKGASNSVSHRIVKLLLPREWYEFLMLARSDYTECNGKRVSLEMFSSMGNGYTFELETLIFYAAAIASGSHKDLTAVYGDDIIVERRCASTLIDLLELLGFETNKKKTFLEGCFFESCGTDWMNGQDVRPIYFKGEYLDQTQFNLYIPNSIRRYSNRRGLGRVCRSSFKKAWVSAYRRCSDLEKRTAIPDGSGDDGLVRNFDESSPSRRWSSHLHAWQGRVIPLRAVKSGRTITNGAYVAALHTGASENRKSRESIRGQTERCDRLQDRPILGWVDLGPWA